MLSILTIETPELGDRSYIVHDGNVALVVDPQRDLDRVLECAKGAGVAITHVAETHVHNDYVSGGLELARLTGAEYLLSTEEEVGYEHHRVADGDSISVGAINVQVRSTPGHTAHHLAYVVRDSGTTRAVLTGGSMLFGTVGRTDLAGSEHTEALTRAQYRSVRGLAATLADEVAVLPTHGFGSFCASSPASEATSATIGEERGRNIALAIEDEDAFVERLSAGLRSYPSYYGAVGALNRAGPGAFLGETPQAVPAEAGTADRRG